MKRITLRLPDELCEEIEKLATEENRSLNAEIVQAIKYYVDMIRRRKIYDKEFAEMKAGNYSGLTEIAKSMDTRDYVEPSPAEILALGS